MDDIHLPFAISVALPLAKPVRPHRDGPMRHPAIGWRPFEASSLPSAPRLLHRAKPDQQRDRSNTE